VSKVFLGFLVVITFFVASSYAHASITPTLSVYATGSGDTVQINVTGGPNESVILYYSSSTSGQYFYSLGSTDSSGNFSTNISSSSYGIVSSAPVHVTLNGINGVSSPVVMWPSISTSGTNKISLSQGGLVLSVGQSNTVVVNNAVGSLYILSNTNPSVANVNINGTQLVVNASTVGSTLVTVCTTGMTSGCPSLSVVVQNVGAQTLTFSQNNINLSTGQNTTVTVSGGNGYYNIINNSNSSLVQSSVNGSVVSLNSNASSGTASITICSTDMSACGIINTTLSGVSSPLTFNQTNPALTVGQSLGVVIYGSSGTYYVSSNSNPTVAQTNISNNILNIYASTSGSAVVNVCSSGGGCGQLSISVSTPTVVNTSPVILSQASLNLSVNQSQVITVTGGTAPYILPVSSSNIFQASVIGNTLTVTAINPGSAQISVCSSSGGCSVVSLFVSVVNNTTPSINSFLNLSQNNPTVSVGQITTVTVSGGSGNMYTVVYNSNSSIATANMSGTMLSITGIKNGYVVLVVCDSANDCVPVSVGVGVSNPSPLVTPAVVTTPTAATIPVPAARYQFNKNLSLGSIGTDVSELQKRLISEGVYTGPINGRFGPLTEAAVKKYQSLHKLSAVGIVGILTRTVLNYQ